MSKAEFQRVSVDEASAMFREDPVSMLKEYERMRDIERKRMNRLQDSKYAWTETANRERSKAYSQMDRRDFAKAFSELSKFLSAKTSTVSGQKSRERKTTQTLNEAIGEKAVNPANYKRTIQILNEARRMKIMYDSAKIVELAENTLALSDEAFEAILDNLESAIQKRNQFTHMTDLDGYSFDDIQNML